MSRMTLEGLVQQLSKAFGEGLRAVVLYGSAASGTNISKRSDYNVLVIVDRIDMSTLEREAAIARSWAEAGNPPPLTMTLEEWRRSSDVFPMEYSDILEAHKVLYGDPPFEGITVSPGDLRLQLEYQALAKLLQLRQGILATGGERGRMVELLAASLSTFMVLFRALLRLHGETAPADYEQIITRVASVAKLSAEPFVAVVRHVRGERKLAEADAPAVLTGYLAGAQHLVAHIDQIGVP